MISNMFLSAVITSDHSLKAIRRPAPSMLKIQTLAFIHNSWVRKFTRAVRNNECENTFNLFTKKKKTPQGAFARVLESFPGPQTQIVSGSPPPFPLTSTHSDTDELSSSCKWNATPDRGSSGYLGAFFLEPPGSGLAGTYQHETAFEIILKKKIIDRKVNQTRTDVSCPFLTFDLRLFQTTEASRKGQKQKKECFLHVVVIVLVLSAVCFFPVLVKVPLSERG